MNSKCVDLIYLEPPFNKNKNFTAPIGSSAEGAEFRDIFREEDVKDEWLVTIQEDQPELFHYLNGIKGLGTSYNFAYLAYMAIRLLECLRVLKPTGSIYLHCDPTMSHYLKALMDCIFCEDNFRNEIVWKRYNRPKGSQHKSRQFGRSSDTILFYSASTAHNFQPVSIPLSVTEIEKRFSNVDEKGRYMSGPLLRSGSMEDRPNLVYEFQGYKPGPSGWRMERSKLQKIYDRDDFFFTSNGIPRRKFRPDDVPGAAVDNVWTDVFALNAHDQERLGYPTQKPLKLLHRIIKASSNEGDLVLDPFCGCATTCVAAEQLGRQWIGIDVSIKAYELVKRRLIKEAADPDNLFKYKNTIHMRTDPPQRTDLAVDYREKKFVYVISHPSYPGEYKVGIAKNWKNRLNAYQTSDPDRQYKIEFTLEMPHFRETERHIHDTFPNKHEWVQGDLNDIIAEIQICAEV